MQSKTKEKTRWTCSNYRKTKCNDIIYFSHGQKHPKIIHDNHVYLVHSREAGRTRWRCRYCNKTSCKAGLFTYGRNVEVFNQHNHHPPAIAKEKLFPNFANVIRRIIPYKSSEATLTKAGELVLEMIYFCSGRKYPKIVVDGYHYIMQKQSDRHSRWRCSYCNKTRCRAILYSFGKTVKTVQSHNHAPQTLSTNEDLIPQMVNVIRG
ncbi:unnamed protein product [Phyllotreta striolata]|uniref:FLYWCH-type domain-containing protein n=1 Tax=Phyllotreta striolata TaxID=444603 RepID=A0A9N9TM30_PHYSR|nr:unnamed protein product [Phyllotreta striolata]